MRIIGITSALRKLTWRFVDDDRGHGPAGSQLALSQPVDDIADLVGVCVVQDLVSVHSSPRSLVNTVSLVSSTAIDRIRTVPDQPFTPPGR